MTALTWNLNVQVGGGASISSNAGPLPVEALDRIEVAIADGANNQLIELQPSVAKQIVLLHIGASKFSADFKCTVTDGTADGAKLVLTEPQLFTAGSIALLGVAPKALKVSNGSGEEITLQVTVARDATP